MSLKFKPLLAAIFLLLICACSHKAGPKWGARHVHMVAHLPPSLDDRSMAGVIQGACAVAHCKEYNKSEKNEEPEAFFAFSFQVYPDTDGNESMSIQKFNEGGDAEIELYQKKPATPSEQTQNFLMALQEKGVHIEVNVDAIARCVIDKNFNSLDCVDDARSYRSPLPLEILFSAGHLDQMEQDDTPISKP